MQGKSAIPFLFADDLPLLSVQQRLVFSTYQGTELIYSTDRFLQVVSIAGYASPVLATIGMSVCSSVRLSVTRWH